MVVDLFLSNTKNQDTSCSILMGDFNAKCLKWCTTEKSITASLEGR